MLTWNIVIRHYADLVNLVIRCRKENLLVEELARFVVDVIACRQRAFRKLSVRDVLLVPAAVGS